MADKKEEDKNKIIKFEQKNGEEVKYGYNDFKSKIDNYLQSHIAGSNHYAQSISYHLKSTITKPGESKTLGDILKPGSDLENHLKDAFKDQLTHMGIKNDYVSDIILRDLGVDIEDLRQMFKGRLNEQYDVGIINEIVESAKSKLSQKLGTATMSELYKLEGTTHYAKGIDYLLDVSGLGNQFPVNASEIKTHMDFQQTRAGNYIRSGQQLHQAAQRYSNRGDYNKKEDKKDEYKKAA